ncbi:MAG: hypothetical protein HOP18_11495 [Deltaproteobacteria bacterium]|nr:hypothetical protein [Deltaproteobacteria bacterium]
MIPPQLNESILGADIHQQERIASAFQAARQQRAVTCSRTIEIAQGGQGFIVVLPLYADDHTFVGAVGGVFQYQELFDLFLTHAAPNFSLRIFEEDVEIYRREPGAKSHAAQWRHERLLPLPGISWRVEVTPTLDLLASLRSSLPGMTFVFGLLTSVLVSFMGRSLQQVKQHARENSAITLALRQEMQVRLAAEQELQAARDHLELRVRRRTEELTVLNK